MPKEDAATVNEIDEIISEIRKVLKEGMNSGTTVIIKKALLRKARLCLQEIRIKVEDRMIATSVPIQQQTLQQVAEETIDKCMKGVGDISISHSVRADPKFPINMLRAIQRQVRRELNKLID